MSRPVLCLDNSPNILPSSIAISHLDSLSDAEWADMRERERGRAP